jgi:hypothetical protein
MLKMKNAKKKLQREPKKTMLQLSFSHGGTGVKHQKTRFDHQGCEIKQTSPTIESTY